MFLLLAPEVLNVLPLRDKRNIQCDICTNVKRKTDFVPLHYSV